MDLKLNVSSGEDTILHGSRLSVNEDGEYYETTKEPKELLLLPYESAASLESELILTGKHTQDKLISPD